MKEPDTNQNAKTLVVGIGSSHGDDQAGWKVIEQLELLGLPDVELRQATVPHDLIDWIGEHVALHIIDGCVYSDPASQGRDPSPVRLTMVKDAKDCLKSSEVKSDGQESSFSTNLEPPIKLRSLGTHHIDVFAVLELAACLNRLPKKVIVWAVPGKEFHPCTRLTAHCGQAIDSCVQRLSEELWHADD